MSDLNDIQYQDIWYQSPDGLQLHARDYSHPHPKAVLLCLPGLTRNAADFDFICDYLHADYRLIAVDQRGRGLSAWDPNVENYNVGVYVRDMFALLDTLALQTVILFGTSLGGLLSMLMAAVQPQRIEAVILNDIGPEIDAGGLARIQRYVGKQQPVQSWDEAVRQTRAINAEQFPDLNDEGWLLLARALYRENANGIPELAYDPAIAASTGKVDAADADEATQLPNLWPQFQSLIHKPLLVLRGKTSDILARTCVDKMKSLKPDMHYCEVENRGHAPLLNERSALHAIDAFLQTL